MNTLDRVLALVEAIAKIDAVHGSGFSFDDWPPEQIVFGIGTDRVIRAKHLREARDLIPELKALQESK